MNAKISQTPFPIELYKIEKHLGKSLTAEVLLLKKKSPPQYPNSPHYIALKKLNDLFFDDPQAQQEFTEEIRIFSSIQHPSVIQFYSAVTFQKQPAFIMEYFKGQTLKEKMLLLQKQHLTLPLHFILTFALNLLKTLNDLHHLPDEQGKPREILHGDLSPKNILLDAHNNLKLFDFGLARDRQSPPWNQTLRGSFGYLAPELLRGTPPHQKSELFALSVILWELLAGRSLFLAGNVDRTLQNIERCAIPHLADVAPHYPEDLLSLVMTNLSCRPEERLPSFATTYEMMRHIDERHTSVPSSEPFKTPC